jgi:DNA-binding Lrp family transcriptional regulator
MPKKTQPKPDAQKDTVSEQFTSLEKRLINILSADLPLSLNPYLDLAQELGITESMVISSIKKMTDKGIIRRFGAVVVHQKSGFTANAMVVWLLEPDQQDPVGEKFAQLPYVSHCYNRSTVPGWPYNLYTMIHAENNDQLLKMVHNMAEISGAKEWQVLESLREFKKQSMKLIL